jgi:hypothetical protein
LFDLHRWLAWSSAGGNTIRAALRSVSHHTGLPVILVAAIVVVVSWRLLRRGIRLAVELALAFGFLAIASHLGWIRW